MAGRSLGLNATAIRHFGDWEFLKNAIGLRGWQGDTARKCCCWLCGACKLCEPYAWDPSVSAAWRQTLVTVGAFWQEIYNGNRHASALWTLPGFTLAYCVPDFMHVICLGVVPYAVGNRMWALFKILKGTHKKWVGACGQLENMMRCAAKDLGVEPPFVSLTLGMIRPDLKSKPYMKLKAADGAQLPPRAGVHDADVFQPGRQAALAALPVSGAPVQHL